jgi:putative nucleotidyltransferase with HDIG domain
MPWPGEGSLRPAPLPDSPPAGRTAVELLLEARSRDRSRPIPEAIASYEVAITAGERESAPTVVAEALRRLAILRGRSGQLEAARALCQRSIHVARELGNARLEAEALNTLGGLALTSGSLDDAHEAFLWALACPANSREIEARVEQNLGILANIQGDLDEAVRWYRRSLDAYRAGGDDHGCAIAYHNLGMVSADREWWREAEHYFRASREIADRTGDPYLGALCLINQAEMDVARQRFENARQDAEAALAVLDQLGVGGAKSGAYRVLGMICRETGYPVLAEARLRAAIGLAKGSGSALNEAESARELALLYVETGRNKDALRLLNDAHGLFRRVNARPEVVHVAGKVLELEATYRAVVRAWAQSIEGCDSSTFGHCERVALNAVAVGRALELDETTETTILLGAYLHDIGNLRVPREILTKAGPLTADERAVARMHPVWGVELLAGIEFPWDIKGIIRWHHERVDGSGYPDRLKGDAIPIGAQVVGICEAYDALTTERTSQSALPAREAVQRIADCRGWWWSERVVDAFVSVAEPRPQA